MERENSYETGIVCPNSNTPNYYLSQDLNSGFLTAEIKSLDDDT